ncbi:MAG: class IV adenylate cyclase [Pirellulales bacterium]|nr:class IV adenylate cyclase [Pirellulales bacterium]
MQYEVELKYPVADMAALQQRLASMGFAPGRPQSEVDLYFAHPGRDFAETDEALRIRRKGTANFITYKGPKIDRTTKTRREIELPLAAGEESAKAWTGLLDVLGFVPVAEVHKSRRKVEILWQGRRVEGSLDDVQRLGTFAELELVVEEDQVEAAKVCIASLAESLQLRGSQRRSYLELLLQKDPSIRRSGRSEGRVHE